MAPWGKVHSAVSNFADRAKGHMLWAHNKYQHGLHLAGKANDLYQTGKRIASIFTPEFNALGLDKPMMQAFGAMDHLRVRGIHRDLDVLIWIQVNSAILGKLRQAQGMAQPYMN